MMSMPTPNTAHGQQIHIEPHFNNLDQTNSVVLLMMPLALPDADVGANGIT